MKASTKTFNSKTKIMERIFIFGLEEENEG
jgi:hypothetical protein